MVSWIRLFRRSSLRRRSRADFPGRTFPCLRARIVDYLTGEDCRQGCALLSAFIGSHRASGSPLEAAATGRIGDLQEEERPYLPRCPEAVALRRMELFRAALRRIGPSHLSGPYRSGLRLPRFRNGISTVPVPGFRSVRHPNRAALASPNCTISWSNCRSTNGPHRENQQ